LVPRDQQRRFAVCVNLIRRIRDDSDDARKRISRLLDLVLHRAFSGDLTAKWRDAHMEQIHAEMEEQMKLLNQLTEALLC